MEGKELKVLYEGGKVEELDEDIRKVLIEHSYKQWASGFDFRSGMRDLAFERN